MSTPVMFPYRSSSKHMSGGNHPMMKQKEVAGAIVKAASASNNRKGRPCHQGYKTQERHQVGC